jgi:hypothetical protein
MENLNSVLSLIATISSAIAGAYAARAAYLSAHSAREAQKSANDAELRALLRELSSTSSRVVVEESRIQIACNDVKRAYRTLAMNTGNSTNSKLALYVGATDKKMITAAELAKDAALFSGGAKSLQLSPLDEIERVLSRQIEALHIVQGIRDDLTREHLSLESDIRDSKPAI